MQRQPAGWPALLAHRQVMQVAQAGLRATTMIRTLQNSPSPVDMASTTQSPMIPEPNRTVSATEPDWAREAKPAFAWAPSRSLLKAIRDYQRFSSARAPLNVFRRKWATLRHRFWSVITGAEIPINCSIGGGLLIPHPNGIVIHPRAVIGPNCLILQQVTLAGGSHSAPHLVGHVDVGAGAKLLGDIVIGAHARVGANSVVLSDVPASRTVAGIPARLIEPTHSTPTA